MQSFPPDPVKTGTRRASTSSNSKGKIPDKQQLSVMQEMTIEPVFKKKPPDSNDGHDLQMPSTRRNLFDDDN